MLADNAQDAKLKLNDINNDIDNNITTISSSLS